MAIVLIFFLLADVVLDVITLIRAAKPWPTWGLVSRFWNILTPFPTAISTLLHLRPKPPTTTTTSTITTLRLADDDKRNSFNPRVSMAGTDVSSISMTWHRWVRRSSITQRSSAHYSSHNYSHDDLEIGFYHVHSHGYHNQRSVAREPSTDFTLREQPGEEDGDSERAGGTKGIDQ
ncbi:hypothetical protein N0V88_002807 [Collariella sp. IMI 366227]|nr:hypothetical protein N0V88_002807 [Collariella sp. IMI 366227]